MENNIPLFPVAGWTAGPVKALELVTFKLRYLTNPMQRIGEANESQMFALSPAQALELADVLQKAVRILQNTEFQAAPGPRH